VELIKFHGLFMSPIERCNLHFYGQVVELPMLHPEKFVKLGIDPPKGVLCYGPPGTGKTLLARAVANRTDACFIRVIGSELVQKYVGEGARMVRELFQVMQCLSWAQYHGVQHVEGPL
jgi:ATP-dependent 26S proteasome regulatory subunit